MAQFVVHDGNGVSIWSASKSTRVIDKITLDPESRIEEITLSCDGNYLALVLKTSVQIYTLSNLKKSLFNIAIKDAESVRFSPKSNFVAINAWMRPQDKNLKLYSVKTGDLVAEWEDRKRKSINWSFDESIAYRVAGSELLFYENSDFSQCKRKFSQKMFSYSFVTNKATGCNFVSVFVKGTKGAPSIVKVHAYPHLENSITSQSLFQVDSVEMKWNSKADAMLIMGSTDVDTTGQSYYGQTALHYLDMKGNSFKVIGKKEGSMHSCEWMPNNEGFLAVYGTMPAAISLFNNKGDIVFNFGQASVNSIYINQFSNLVAFGGFGNLSGDILVWNLKTKSLISHFKAPDTTQLTWAADGLHIVTSTHYARLKVDNGFKVWDYLGNLLHKEQFGTIEQVMALHTLWQIPSDQFTEPEIGKVKGQLLSEKPSGKYIPPHLRKPNQKPFQTAPATSTMSVKEKKLKNLSKKLEQIELLKKALAEGKQLEKNQLEKIEKENDIVNELNLLKLEA